MKQNKKGVSDVVTTVLIVMLTVAAVGVIAGVVVPFVKNSLQKSTECMDYKGFYTFDESFNLNCKSGDLYNFSIKTISIGTGSGSFTIGTRKNMTNYTVASSLELIENVARMKLVLTRLDGTTESAEIIGGSEDIKGKVKMMNGSLTLALPGPGGTKSYTYNASSGDKFVSAEVYPILKNDRICADVKESIKIRDPC